MSYTTNILFFVLVAILGGTLLFGFVLKEKRRPIFIVAIHGILAMVSYGLLINNIAMDVTADEKYPFAKSVAFIFFSLAIIGGTYMIIRDKILKMGLPKWIPFFHAGLALTGLIILIIATLAD